MFNCYLMEPFAFCCESHDMIVANHHLSLSVSMREVES